MNDVRAKIRRYIEDNFIMGASSVALRDDDSFLENHVLDSTGFLELIGFLEETFAVEIADHEMMPENLDSVESIVKFLAHKRGS